MAYEKIMLYSLIKEINIIVKELVIMQSPHKNLKRMSDKRLENIDKIYEKYRKLIESKNKLQKNIESLNKLDIKKIAPRFFSDAETMNVKAEKIQKQVPEERENIIQITQNVLDHKIDLLGVGLQNYGFPFKWNKDYRENHEWPKDIELLSMGDAAFDIVVDKTVSAEIKAPWDLSNMHWIPSLTAAYYFTGDKKYVDIFVADTKDWLKENKPFSGVNWFCPMNIAMRAINLIVGLTAFHPVLGKDFIEELITSLYLHGVVILAYLESGGTGKRNNHYLTNVVGIHFLAIFFEGTDFAEEWLEFSESELELEAGYHFYNDGVIFEDSSSYHRLSVELLLYSAILGRINKRPFSIEFTERLYRSLNFTKDIMQANNNIPQFGDNDNGRLIQFYGYSTAPVTDHRHILALGGEFFNDDTLRCRGLGTEAEAIWVLGDFKLDSLVEEDRDMHLKIYNDGKYYIFRNAETTFVLRNAPINKYCGGGHAHCDQLSFTLNYKGNDLFVDPGAYRYSSDFKARNAFRSVNMHNTIQVNNTPMHMYDEETFAGLWWMSDNAHPETDYANLVDGVFEFQGKIHSYEAEDGCLVLRKLAFDSNKEIIKIDDSVTTSHQTPLNTIAYSRFLLGAEIEVKHLDERHLNLSKEGKTIAVFAVGNKTANIAVNNSWFSPRYGERVSTKQIVVSWKPQDETTLTTTIKLG